MKKLRVHILYEHSGDLRPHGCSYIRLLLPLSHPTVADSIAVSHSTDHAKADVTIVERTWSPSVTAAKAKDLVEQVRRDGSALIYSIDDNLLDLRPQGFNRPPFTTEQLMAMRCFAREADGVIVTTSFLKDRLSRLNDTIFVVPNALDERLWGTQSPLENSSGLRNSRKVIGYMGTHTHDADLMMVLQPLREILRKHSDQVELQLIGGFSDRAVMEAFTGLPVKLLDVGNNVEYPAFARWMIQNVKWDLAIAPLEENNFTRCKSDIKFLDYSILGIPGIYSDGPVYGKTIRHLETGYLAENNPHSWAEGLDLLLNDDLLRKSIAGRAWEYTSSTRTLQQCAVDWKKAIFSITDQRETRLRA
jgi:processive 1,2-diacylglycerol beta-glucosyltransferase